MNRRFNVLVTWLIVVLTSFVISAVKQVRVTTDRATIYAEPSRNSAKIDVVEKGAVLNLFQPSKVRDVWYYVSYTSANYGSRISGFIHESSVELVAEPGVAPPKPEELKSQEKPAPPPAPEKPTPPPPKVAEKKITQPAPTPVTTIEVSVGLTPLRRAKSISLPKKEKLRVDAPWQTIVLAKEEKKKPSVKASTPKAKEMVPEKPVAPPEIKKVQPEAKKEKPTKKAEVKKEEPKIRLEAEKQKKARPKMAKPAPAEPSRIVEPKRARGPFTFGLGYGPSYGGAGGLLQLNTRSGLALHGGVGMYPAKFIYSGTSWVRNQILYSAGVKYYLPFKSRSVFPYFDLQYGGLSVEAVQISTGIWGSSELSSHEQKTLWGPSFLAGLEIRVGHFGINGGAAVSYNLTKWEYVKQNLLFSFDVSLLIYF